MIPADGTCTCHRRAMAVSSRCHACGTTASPLKGVFLARLYPGQSSCDGCGRRQVHCTCPRHP